MVLQRLNYDFEWGTSLRAGELKRNNGVIFIQTYLMIRKEDDSRNKKPAEISSEKEYFLLFCTKRLKRP